MCTGYRRKIFALAGLISIPAVICYFVGEYTCTYIIGSIVAVCLVSFTIYDKTSWFLLITEFYAVLLVDPWYLGICLAVSIDAIVFAFAAIVFPSSVKRPNYDLPVKRERKKKLVDVNTLTRMFEDADGLSYDPQSKQYFFHADKIDSFTDEIHALFDEGIKKGTCTHCDNVSDMNMEYMIKNDIDSAIENEISCYGYFEEFSDEKETNDIAIMAIADNDTTSEYRTAVMSGNEFSGRSFHVGNVPKKLCPEIKRLMAAGEFRMALFIDVCEGDSKTISKSGNNIKLLESHEKYVFIRFIAIGEKPNLYKYE